MKTKPKIQHKWSMRLTPWASLPIIVNIWTSGFSGKVLPCELCRKSRVTQPHNSFWPGTLHAACPDCVKSGERDIPFCLEKLLGGLQEEIGIGGQLFWKFPWSAKILRWRFTMASRVSVILSGGDADPWKCCHYLDTWVVFWVAVALDTKERVTYATVTYIASG